MQAKTHHGYFFWKLRDTEKMLKASMKNQHITYKNTIILSTGISTETVESGIKWHISQVLEELATENTIFSKNIPE